MEQAAGDEQTGLVRLRVSFKGRFTQASWPLHQHTSHTPKQRQPRAEAGTTRRRRSICRLPLRLSARISHPLLAALQGEGGSWRYLGGDHFLESLPDTTRYADMMFSLSEKVDGAVSVKYLLPGEELDPDSLISVNDDNDIKVRSSIGSCGGGACSTCSTCSSSRSLIPLPVMLAGAVS
jgi:hypothetical protein